MSFGQLTAVLAWWEVVVSLQRASVERGELGHTFLCTEAHDS